MVRRLHLLEYRTFHATCHADLYAMHHAVAHAASFDVIKPRTSTTATLLAGGALGVAALLVFNLAVFQAPVANRDAVRHANQLPVGKHGARA